MAREVSDLPLPDSPIKQNISSLLIEKDISSTSVVFPLLILSWSTSSNGSSMISFHHPSYEIKHHNHHCNIYSRS